MNFFALTGLINGLTSLFLFCIVLFSNRRKGKISFLLFTFSVIAWSFGYVLWQNSFTFTDALYWSRFLMIGAIFIPFTYLHFVINLSGNNKLVGLKKINYLIPIFFLAVNFFDMLSNRGLLIKSVENRLNFEYWPIPGPIFHLFIITWLGIVIFSTYLLYKSLKNSSGIKRSQIKYVLLGMLFGYIGGITNYFLWYNIPIPPIGNIFVSLYVFFIAISIFKYRLLNIKFIITRSLIYIVLVSIIATTFILASSITASIFEDLGVNQYIVWIAFAILVVAGMDPLKNLFASLTDRIFYKDKIDYNIVLKSLSNIINEEIELPSLVKHIEENLVNQLKVQDAQLLLGVYGEQIFLPLTDYLAFTPAKRSKNRVAADKHVYYNSALIQYMRKVKIAIVTDEFERYIYDLDEPTKQKKLNKILHDMQGLETGTTAPIIREGKMVALLLIGNKVSGETFSNEDINLLEVLSSQLAAAIERSKLYQEVQDFNLKLQKEVEKATKNLLRANDQLKEANIHLKELDSAKSEFMSIASHQLRTPLAGIVGYLSMILDGDYGKIDNSQQKIVSEVFAASQRLVRLVNTFLNVTRIEAGRFTLSFVNVNFVDLVRGEVMELQPTADKKNVKLVYEEPKDKNLMAMVDDKIRDAVLNLIDNAIKYTPDGTVTVRLEKEGKDMLHYSVKDSGVGISKDEVDNLFQKFVRGSGIAKIQPNGSGLGLYIVKKIVEGHGGKVWAESEGEGKGSTFNIRIPIKQSKPEFRAKAEQIFTGKTLI